MKKRKRFGNTLVNIHENSKLWAHFNNFLKIVKSFDKKYIKNIKVVEHFIYFLSIIALFFYGYITLSSIGSSYSSNFKFLGLNFGFIIYNLITTLTFVIIISIMNIGLRRTSVYMKRKYKNRKLKIICNYAYKISLRGNFYSALTLFLFWLITIIGNALFPIIFQNNLPIILPITTHYVVLGNNAIDDYPKISNITCQSSTNKETYVLKDILNCKFTINKISPEYTFDKIALSRVNSSFDFNTPRIIPPLKSNNSITFSILLEEPEINYFNLYIDFKDSNGLYSTLYSVRYWIINPLIHDKYQERNYKKFAYIFGLFSFSMIAGLSIVRNLKEIMEPKK